MITRMDEGIGELLAQLKQLGLDENTVVMFSSDNGPHREGGPLQNPDFFAASGPLGLSPRLAMTICRQPASGGPVALSIQ